MALICIIFGFILEQTLSSINALRNFHWFDRYSKWLIEHLPILTNQGNLSIAILLMPVIVAVIILQYYIDDKFFGLLSLIFGLGLFVYCLGPGDLNHEIDGFLNARENADEEQAQHFASIIMGKDASTAHDQQTADVMRAILHQSNDRFFSVIFWFVILGPFGALLYRLTSYTMQTSTNKTLADAASTLQAILAWAPAHIIAAAYALTGNYEGASASFRGKQKQNNLSESNYHTLITAGLGALRDCTSGDESACIRSTRGLVLRALVVWLAVIATLTLMGWMA